ncbi:MAG: hypothetical protein BWY68_00348 [bacterium ADurb.Bin400]|nr:MAG: hypothetical protein BWY68_00348 [bacterium ADurb.Bin400]
MGKRAGTFISLLIGIAAISGIAIYAARSDRPSADVNRGTRTDNSANQTPVEEIDEDEIAESNEESGEYKENLAKHLAAKGMVMYGTYWCKFCNAQKELFSNAFQYVNYVECDSSGENANPDACDAQDIKGYPTWVYQGQKYPGVRSLGELASLTDYTEAENNLEEPAPEGAGNPVQEQEANN